MLKLYKEGDLYKVAKDGKVIAECTRKCNAVKALKFAMRGPKQKHKYRCLKCGQRAYGKDLICGSCRKEIEDNGKTLSEQGGNNDTRKLS